MQAVDIVKEWFARVSKGDGPGALELFDDEIEYTVQGSSPVSGTYRGKRALVKELFIPFQSRLDGDIVLEPKHFIVEGDDVAVLAEGRAKTKRGEAYNNSYCIVFRVGDGRITHLNEFLDTALVETAIFEKSLS